MKAEELMRNDWVYVDNENAPRQVDWIRSGEVGLLWSQTVTPPYLKPIPLTPEILEKNGFVKHDTWDEWVHYTTGIFIDFILLVDENGFHLDIPNARINYVHELQHALRLCNINKEIEV